MIMAAAVLFSTGGAAIKATSLTGWQVASFRSGIAALTLLVFLPRSRRRPTAAMWLVGVVYAATLVLFVTATKLTTSANAIFLQDTSPLYVVLLSPLVLRERIKRADVWFMAALAAGLVAFLLGNEAPRQSASNPHLGDLVAAISGLTWAATVIGLRWLNTRTQDRDASEPALVAGNIMAFVAALPLALPTAGTTTTDWAIVVYLGVIQIGLAYVCFSIGMARVPAIEASLLLLLEPVLNPVFSWLVHGEVPNGWSMIGGAIILCATTARTLWDAHVGNTDERGTSGIVRDGRSTRNHTE
jgi:DME family drug/metabolite transporter